jgi:putative transposase
VASGHRRVLGVSVALSEAKVHWRAFLDSLIQRGLGGVKLIASDDHAGLKAARKALFAGVPWQRCQFHLQHNAQGYVSKLDQRQTVARQIRNIFNAPDVNEANRPATSGDQRLGELSPQAGRLGAGQPRRGLCGVWFAA